MLNRMTFFGWLFSAASLFVVPALYAFVYGGSALEEKLKDSQSRGCLIFLSLFVAVCTWMLVRILICVFYMR